MFLYTAIALASTHVGAQECSVYSLRLQEGYLFVIYTIAFVSFAMMMVACVYLQFIVLFFFLFM